MLKLGSQLTRCQGWHGKEERSFMAILNTWSLAFIIFSRGRNTEHVSWEVKSRNGYQRWTDSGVVRRELQFANPFSTACQSSCFPYSLILERFWTKGWWSCADVIFISALWIHTKVSLNLWFLHEVLWPQANREVQMSHVPIRKKWGPWLWPTAFKRDAKTTHWRSLLSNTWPILLFIVCGGSIF